MNDWDNFDNIPTDDDDDGLDWLDDDSLFEKSASGGKQPGQSTGLTGELPWLQDADDKKASRDDDDDLAWLDDDAEEEPVASELGDDLAWDAIDFGDANDDDDGLSWLDDDAEETEPIPTPEPTTEWQSPHPARIDTEFESKMEAAEFADFGNVEDDLDWLSEAEDAGVSATDSGEFALPDWMSGMEIPDVPDEEVAAAHSALTGNIDAEEDEESVSFASLLGDFDADDDEDADSDFASILAGNREDDDDDLGFLGSFTDDDEETASLPTGSGTAEPADTMWGSLGAGFTQELKALPDKPESEEPANTGWGLGDDDDLGFSLDAEHDEPLTENDDDDDWLSGLGAEVEQPEMDAAFEAMFSNQGDDDESWMSEPEIDEPDWMSAIEAPADDVQETDDLLAELDAVGTNDVDMDDLLAELDADEDYDETYSDAIDPLAFDSGITDIFNSVDGDELSFLAEMEAELGGGDEEFDDEEFDDEFEPLAFDTGITDFINTMDSQDLEALSDLDSQLEADAEYDDAVDPLAFDTGVTDLIDNMDAADLEALFELDNQLEADYTPSDFVPLDEDETQDPGGYKTGFTDLINTMTTSELTELEHELNEELSEDDVEAVNPRQFKTGFTDLINKMDTGELAALEHELNEELSAEDDVIDDDDTDDSKPRPLGLTGLIGETIADPDESALEFLAALEEQELDETAVQDINFDFDFGDDVVAETDDQPEADFDFDFGDDVVAETDDQPEADFDFDFGDDVVAETDDQPEADFDFDFGDDVAAETDDQLEADFDFDFGDDVVAETDDQLEADFDFDVDSTDESQLESDFDFTFGGEIEEEVSPPLPVTKKPDTGLLSRTDDDDDFGFDDGDWLSELDQAIEDQDEADALAAEAVDVAALLESFEDFDEDKFAVIDDEADSSAVDLDAVLDEYDDAVAAEQADSPGAEAGEIPEWLRDAASGKGDTYAATKMIRDLKNRSLDDLDDRLLDLHERGLELTSDEVDSAVDRERLTRVVPNIGEALVPTKAQTVKTTLGTPEPKLTSKQLQQVDLLRSIVGEVVAGEVEVSVAPRRRWRIPVGRWLIAILLVAAVITPFFITDFNISKPLPTTFDSANPGAELAGYTLIDNLQPSAKVLFAVEYGATGARELDLMTEALLIHLLNRGVQPVIVSSNAVGSLRAETIAARLAGDDGYNREYYVAGFLPGDNLGLRDLTENLDFVVANNSNGQPTGLDMRSLDEFETIILIAEGGETVRDWMEQVVPGTNTPFIIAISQSARPVAQTYVEAHLGNRVRSFFVGYQDAVTYHSMILAQLVRPTATPPSTDTSTPTLTPQPTETQIPTLTPQPTAADGDAEAVVPALESTQDETPSDEDTSTPTQTPIIVTSTPIPPTSEQVESDSDVVEVAIVRTTGVVNVREGPGAGFRVVGVLEPEDQVIVLERDESGAWIKFEFPNGNEAWIAEFLTEIQFMPRSEVQELHRREAVRFLKPPPRDFQQGSSASQTPTETTDPLVRVGRNIAAVALDVFATADLTGTRIEDLASGTEFIVLDQVDAATQILLADGRIGWVESRLVRVVEVPLSASGIDPTATPTAPPSSTPMPAATVTGTPTETATPFAPDVFPEPIPNVDARWNAMTLGLLAAILVIFVGNAYWLIRWLRRRGA